MKSNDLLRLSDLAEPPVGFLKWWFYRDILGRDLDVERDMRRLDAIMAFHEKQHTWMMETLFPEQPKTQPWDGYTIT